MIHRMEDKNSKDSILMNLIKGRLKGTMVMEAAALYLKKNQVVIFSSITTKNIKRKHNV